MGSIQQFLAVVQSRRVEDIGLKDCLECMENLLALLGDRGVRIDFW